MNWARARNLIGKGIALTPLIAAQPRLAWLALRGVHLGEYTHLNHPWLHSANIHTVIDVGAHKGQFSSAVRALLPEARIYAFEPIPSCYERLAKRLGRADRFHSFNVALGASKGTATLNQSEFSKSSSILAMTALHRAAFPWTARHEPLEVAVEPLDGFLPRMEIDPQLLVKIDVQGYEADVIRGATRTLSMARYVLTEVSFDELYSGQPLFGAVHDLLRDAGFRHAGSLDQLVSPLDGSVLQADALFVRP